MSLFFKKISFIQLSTQSSLDNVVLPLITVIHSHHILSIKESCLLLSEQLQAFLQQAHTDSPDELEVSIEKVKKYFEDVQAGTLFPSLAHSKQVQNILSTLASFLCEPNQDVGVDMHSLYGELFLAIDERDCMDDHASNLNSLSVHLSAPLLPSLERKTLQYLQKKLLDLIRDQLLSLDLSTFKGFTDTESSHSVHITLIILDDIYKIAGGKHRNDTNMLIKRTHIAYDILRELFQGKLTIGNLLSTPESNWQTECARELSKTAHYTGDIYTSILEFSESKNFLDYLFHKNFLTKEQRDLFKNPDHLYQEGALDFFKPFADVSSDINTERILYTPLFSEQLLSYIHETILSQYFFEPEIENSDDHFAYDPMPEILRKKIIKLFTHPSSITTFSYDEIFYAIGQKNTELKAPFLKPYISPVLLMIAHCDPKYARKIFKRWLLPYPDSHFTQSSLLLMANINHEAIHKIGIDVLINPLFSYPKTCRTLLQRLIFDTPSIVEALLRKDILHLKFLWKPCPKYSPLHLLYTQHPKMLESWIKKNLIPIDILIKSTDYNGRSVLHWMAEVNPSFLHLLVINNYATPNTLIKVFDFDDSSVAHWLARYGVDILNQWVQENYLSVHEICSLIDVCGRSVLHSLCQYNPQIVALWIKQCRLTVEEMMDCRDDMYRSCLHCIAQYKPELLVLWVEQRSIVIEDLCDIADKLGNTVFHWLAMHSPDTLEFWMRQDRFTFELLCFLRDNKGISVVQSMAQHHPEILLRWVDYGFTTVNEIFEIKDKKGVSVSHCLAQYSPRTLDYWLSSKMLTINDFADLKDNSGNSVFHWLAQHNAKLIDHWIKQNHLKVQDLFWIKTRSGYSVIHWLALYKPRILDKWVSRNWVCAKDLLALKTNSGHTIAYWLKATHPEILSRWNIR